VAFGRKQGAQKGNANALKHGLYSSVLNPKLAKFYRKASEISAADLQQEIATLRTLLTNLVDIDAANLTVVNMTLRTLVRLVALHHALSAEDENELHHSMRDLVRELMVMSEEPRESI